MKFAEDDEWEHFLLFDVFVLVCVLLVLLL